MIKILSFTMLDAHRYGNIFEKMLKLRHKGFILEEKYEVRDYNGLEFDQYDDPYAHYIATMHGEDIVACSRMRRTDVVHQVPSTTQTGESVVANVTYMARDLWVNQIPEEYLIASENHYEFTRVYVDSSLPLRERTKLTSVIISASYIYMLSLKGVSFSFVTYKTLFNMVRNLGMDICASRDVSIANFGNLQYAVVNLLSEKVNDVISALYKKTGFNIEDFASQRELRVYDDFQNVA